MTDIEVLRSLPNWTNVRYYLDGIELKETNIINILGNENFKLGNIVEWIMPVSENCIQINVSSNNV